METLGEPEPQLQAAVTKPAPGIPAPRAFLLPSGGAHKLCRIKDSSLTGCGCAAYTLCGARKTVWVQAAVAHQHCPAMLQRDPFMVVSTTMWVWAPKIHTNFSGTVPLSASLLSRAPSLKTWLPFCFDISEKMCWRS